MVEHLDGVKPPAELEADWKLVRHTRDDALRALRSKPDEDGDRWLVVTPGRLCGSDPDPSQDALTWFHTWVTAGYHVGPAASSTTTNGTHAQPSTSTKTDCSLIDWGKAYDGRQRSASPPDRFDLLTAAGLCAERLKKVVCIGLATSERDPEWIPVLRWGMLELDEAVAWACTFGWPNAETAAGWAMDLGGIDLVSKTATRSYPTWLEHSIDVSARVRRDFLMMFDRDAYNRCDTYSAEMVVNPDIEIAPEVIGQFREWGERGGLFARADELPALAELEMNQLGRVNIRIAPVPSSRATVREAIRSTANRIPTRADGDNVRPRTPDTLPVDSPAGESQEREGDESGAVSPKKKKLAWLGPAMLLKQEHPDWSDATVAKTVGTHPSSLSRNATYKKAAAIARGDANVRPSGFKKDDGDVEGIHYDADPEF
ncbi:MAG: hypothetical protein R3C10_04005 [Pirellulales bacterium]